MAVFAAEVTANAASEGNSRGACKRTEEQVSQGNEQAG